jgi:amino acid adenylation domain-containing protein
MTQKSSFPMQEIDQTIDSRFEKVAYDCPDQVAVSHNGFSLTYSSLDHRANWLAHKILERFGDQPELVALLLENPVNQVIAQLGALKAGKICVPMDFEFPLARQAQILDDSGARIILTESKHLSRAEALLAEERQLLVVDEIASDFSALNPHVPRDPASLAYVLYTSGSTGKPKGVMQSHRNLLHVAMLYHDDLGVGSNDRLSTPTSLAYTGTIWMLLGAITNGATYVSSNFDSPYTLLQTLLRERVTVAQLIVTLLRQIMRAFNERVHLPDLRLVYTGGEALQKEDVQTFASTFPEACQLLYNFGSTEAGMITHLPVNLSNARNGEFQQETEDPAFPVGYPVKNTVVIALDESGQMLAEKEDGEIAVSSPYLSQGYWRDADLTEKRFPPNMADKYGRLYLTGDLGRIDVGGRLIHMGRKDRQTKIRGYRINLEEIEATLRSIDGIAAAAVRAHENGQGSARLVGYIERQPSSQLSIDALRRSLGAILPTYMIPSLFLWMDHLPVAPTGKINRQSLPVPDDSRPELNTPLVLPRTNVEQILCELLSGILRIEPIGIQDNFFDLGVDSFALFQFIGRIRNTLQVDIQPRSIFNTPMIEDLARMIEENRISAEHNLNLKQN